MRIQFTPNFFAGVVVGVVVGYVMRDKEVVSQFLKKEIES